MDSLGAISCLALCSEDLLQNTKPVGQGRREVADTKRGLQRQWLGGGLGTKGTGGGAPAASSSFKAGNDQIKPTSSTN